MVCEDSDLARAIEGVGSAGQPALRDWKGEPRRSSRELRAEKSEPREAAEGRGNAKASLKTCQETPPTTPSALYRSSAGLLGSISSARSSRRVVLGSIFSARLFEFWSEALAPNRQPRLCFWIQSHLVHRHGFRQDSNSSEVPYVGKGYRLRTRSGRDFDGPDQLPQRPFPRPQEGPSQPSWPLEDGRQTSSAPELHEADRRRRLSPSRTRTRAPVLIGCNTRSARAHSMQPARLHFSEAKSQ